MEIIIPHINADLDALGAAIGASVLYPRAVIVLPGPPNDRVSAFLSLHRYHLPLRSFKTLKGSKVTRAIVVDTADPARIGPLAPLVAGAELHLFDHHPEEADDLRPSLEVRAQVGAATTLLTELIAESGARLTPLQATAMLLGIYADTGSLTLAGTTDRDAAAAAFLLRSGANLQAVARFIQASLSPDQQALLEALQESSRTLNVRGTRLRIATAQTPEYVGGLAMVVHQYQQIYPSDALFALVRMADRVHMVGRSEAPWVDVAQILSVFRGGGHARAASAVVKGASVEEASADLERALHACVAPAPLARDLMRSPVKTVSEGMTLREAERLMLRHGHSGMPVVGPAGELVGIISLRDVEKAHRHGLGHVPVRSVMVRRVLTAAPDTPLDAVRDLMLTRDIGRVPVMEGESIVGIITRSDLLGLLYGGAAPRWHRTLFEAAPGADGSLPDVPDGLRSVLKTAGAVAGEMNLSAYAVGGFVRDLLLGRPNFDLDIAVEGDGLAFARALGRTLGARVEEVPRFGTAHLFRSDPPDGLDRIDVATARREFYEHAAALPVVEHADLREDLYRRDFTINAMALLLGGQGPAGLVDFFGGRADLSAGLIRILHSLSFVEDPTRILRAVRFVHRYGFELEPDTQEYARRAIADGFLEKVSMERLRQELTLILQEERSGGALLTLQEMGALQRMLPGLEISQALADLVDSARETERYGAQPWVVKLAVLLHQMEERAGVEIVHGLKLRREVTQGVVQALETWRAVHAQVTAPGAGPGAVVQALAGLGPAALSLLALVGAGEQVERYWNEWRHVRLAVTGADLTRAGVPAGPLIGRVLARLLADRLDGKAPDRAAQLALALAYAREEG